MTTQLPIVALDIEILTLKFKSLLSTLKTSYRTKILDFRRAKFNMKHARRAKELVSTGSYLRTTSWKNKNRLSPTKRKDEGRTGDHPGLTMSFWVHIGAKKNCIIYGKKASMSTLRTTRTLLRPMLRCRQEG